MKYLLLISLTLLPLTSFSKGKERDAYKEFEKKMEKMTVEEAKKTKLDMLDRKSSMIDDERKCIKDSKDKEEIKKCMKVMKEAQRSMKDEKMNY